MKKLIIGFFLIAAMASAANGASPFSEDPVEVNQSFESGSAANENHAAGDNQAVEPGAVKEVRPSPEDLNLEINAFFRTLDLMSRYPEEMPKYLKMMENIEKELASQLFNEIDYGVSTLYKRKMNGEPAEKLIATRDWTNNWTQALDQVVLASAQFRNVALNPGMTYVPVAGDTQESSEAGQTPQTTDSGSADQSSEGGQSGAADQSSSGDKPPVTEKPKPTTIDSVPISETGKRQMENVVRYAMGHHRGGSNGFCFNAVWGYLSNSGYGNIRAWGDLPRMKSGLARYFADYMNAGQGNLSEAGLQRLDTALKPPVTNPHDSRIPKGAVIVVAAGSTGTADPVAGDIVIKGDGRFINDGPNMWYGTRDTWRGKLLGVYVPK